MISEEEKRMLVKGIHDALKDPAFVEIGFSVRRELAEFIADAVEKQTPMKPEGNSCPSCGWSVVHRYYCDTCCHRCGQAIDWSEDE